MPDVKRKIISPKGRVSYQNIVRPRTNDDGSKTWDLVLILDQDPAALQPMIELANDALKAKFGQDAKFGAKYCSPFRKEDSYEISDYPEYAGKIMAPMRSKNRPVRIVDTNRQDLDDPATQFYSGCWAHCTLTAYAYDFQGKKGVAFGLSTVMKVADGETLVSRADPEKDFEALDTSMYKQDNSALMGATGKPSLADI